MTTLVLNSPLSNIVPTKHTVVRAKTPFRQVTHSAILSEGYTIAQWERPTLTNIRNLKWLQAGWDGPGSEPISQWALDIACELVGILAEEMPYLASPTVVPTPYSGVYVEWWTSQRSVAMTIHESSVGLDYEAPDVGEWEGTLSGYFNQGWLKALSLCK